MTEEKKNKQLKRFSFILHGTEDFKVDDPEIRKKFAECLKKVTNKWVFQLEQGEKTGKFHYQGRMSFKEPKRRTEVPKVFPDFPNISIKIEGPDEVKSAFYCMKEDTRIDGPWSDKDGMIYIPRQVREVMDSWYPWQQAIIDSINNWEPRRINLIIDKNGCQGKSVVSTYLGASRLASELPYCNDFKDMMRMIYDKQDSWQNKCPAFLMDMPRCLNKQKLHGLYGALEIVKKGYAYDDRYSYKECYFDSPVIWVFTNEQPDLSMLTLDRWAMWEIHEGNLRAISKLEGGTEEATPKRAEISGAAL